MMSNVIASAFETVSTVSAGVQLLEAFSVLAVRPAMKQSVERKIIEVMALFQAECKKIKSEFEKNRRSPPLLAAQARYSGAALWARSLLDRLRVEYEAIINAKELKINSSDMEEAHASYAQIHQLLDTYIKQCHTEWTDALLLSSSSIDPNNPTANQLNERLSRPLLVRSIAQADIDERSVHAKTKQQMASKLLAKNKTSGHLESNFDKGLLRLFAEVRGWEKFHGELPIPYSAQEMYAQQEPLRVIRESVQLVVRDYNTILDALSAEERRLFTEHLRRVDRKIHPGLNKLNWNEKHIKDWFVRVCRGKCQEVYDIVIQFQQNNEKIMRNCNRMSELILFDIEKNVVYDDLAFEQKQLTHQIKCKQEMEGMHAEIVSLMRASYAYFKDDPIDIQREWVKYVKKVDGRIEEALRNTVKKSLQELSRSINGDNKSEAHALFKVNCILDEIKGKVEFRPSMSDLSTMVKQISRQSITTIQIIPRMLDILTQLQEREQKAAEDAAAAAAVAAAPPPPVPQENVPIASPSKRGSISGARRTSTITSPVPPSSDKEKIEESKEESKEQPPSSVVPPLSDSLLLFAQQPKSKSFYELISNDEEILKILVNIMHGTTNVAVDLGKIISHFDHYAPIWNTDKAAFIRRYANTRRPLASFDMDISRYRHYQQEIQEEDPSHSVNFIRVDCSLLKSSLVSHCQQWQLKLTNLLHQNAHADLMALHQYFADNTVKLLVKPDVLDRLAEQIKLLQRLQSESMSLEGKFGPIEDMYRCLDKFDIHIPDEEKDLLDQLRSKYSAFQVSMNEADQSLKLKMVDMKKELEDNLLSYNQHVIDTKNEWKDHAPFSAPMPGQGEPDVDGALHFIEEFKRRISDNRQRADAMKRGMDIFGLEQQEYKETDDVEKELIQLERVWILMKEWINRWNSWRTGKFSELVPKELDSHASSYQKNLNKCSRAVKQWKVWKALFAIIQRFRQTMPLISDLRSPAMRKRHWQQLQDEINQTFDPSDSSFTLDKVFQLNLHLHNEVIANIAAVAARELTIENSLKDISSMWASAQLELIVYKNKYNILRTVDEINDNLETHQLSLSTMKNSPYYLTFSNEINYWARTLNDIVETLEALTTVQRQWKYLESIFMDSVDIRKQLPSESSLFESINAQWCDIMNKQTKTRKVIDLLLENDLLDRLNRINETLERINHSLDEYLEKKRQLFPRFYFLSNDDLLEILGQSRDPSEVQKHIRKCFAGIHKLDLLPPQKSTSRCYEVVGLISADGEEIKLNSSVLVEGEVEHWLNEVERSMQETLQKLLYIAITHVQKASHKKSALEQWVRSCAGQLLILSSQIGWTAKCASALSDQAKNKKSMKRLKVEWHEYLAKLARYVRGDLDEIERAKLTALITIEVHARDVIEKLKQAAKSKVTPNSFEWTSQLRFYFDKPQGDFGRCLVKQTNTSFNYGYEYQGNSGRLVITPLTDRCYLTLTTALNLARGGSPQGPAGTGKTETVKDLAKSLGQFCLVFNCSSEDNVVSLGRNFSGIAQSGAWGCFDEFNRILIEVLSVTALQIAAIFDAIKAGSSVFTLEGRQIRLNKACGIFVTMNPGYAGRTELPDNLKSLFRPVAMMVPDAEQIAEIMLQSEGFKDAQILSKKMITVYNLIEKQLSKQSHYATGLRAIKSVLIRAGQLNRRRDNDLSEELVLMRALKDMNSSKLIHDDQLLFDSLLSDVFPSLELPQLDYTIMKAEIERQCVKEGLQAHAALTDKIIQLYETLQTRHGNMLVGQTCSAKSTAWKILAATFAALSEQRVKGFDCVDVSVINPKAVSTDELYGYFNLAAEWHDGILSSVMRKACTSETPTNKWILLDGPVDTLWVESMNSVLDDNKVLTLINGDRITMPQQVGMLFEVEDLIAASPATVSRCGMVYMDVSSIGWKPFVTSWIARKQAALEQRLEEIKEQQAAQAAALAAQTAANAGAGAPSTATSPLPPSVVVSSIATVAVASSSSAAIAASGPQMSKDGIDLLTKLFDKYVTPILAFKRNNPEIKELIQITEFNAVRSLCRLFDSLATVENGVDPADESNYLRMIEMWFTFCCIWSLGGAVDDPSRTRFDQFIRDLEAQFPPLQTCYEYYVDASKKDWCQWEDKVNNSWRPSPHTPFYKILVPTIDTVRHTFIVSALVRNKHATLIVGVTGVGKTSLVESLLDGLDPSSLSLTLNFSAATSSESVQSIIESRLEKRQRNNYGPREGKSRIILFLDDLNMCSKTEFGSQPAIELLRQYIDYSFFYDRQKQFRKNIMDMQIIGSMGPPGGARSVISQRFQSKFNLLQSHCIRAYLFKQRCELIRRE